MIAWRTPGVMGTRGRKWIRAPYGSLVVRRGVAYPNASLPRGGIDVEMAIGPRLAIEAGHHRPYAPRSRGRADRRGPQWESVAPRLPYDRPAGLRASHGRVAWCARRHAGVGRLEGAYIRRDDDCSVGRI